MQGLVWPFRGHSGKHKDSIHQEITGAGLAVLGSFPHSVGNIYREGLLGSFPHSPGHEEPANRLKLKLGFDGIRSGASVLSML